MFVFVVFSLSREEREKKERDGGEEKKSKAEKWSSIKQIEIGILVVSLNENKLDLKLLSCLFFFFLIVKSASVFYKCFKRRIDKKCAQKTRNNLNTQLTYFIISILQLLSLANRHCLNNKFNISLFLLIRMSEMMYKGSRENLWKYFSLRGTWEKKKKCKERNQH